MKLSQNDITLFSYCYGIDQFFFLFKATLSEGPPVDRSRAWCSMLNIPFYRFSPRLSEDIPLDCHDNKAIIKLMWETQCYIVANKEKIERLGKLLRTIHDAKQNA